MHHSIGLSVGLVCWRKYKKITQTKNDNNTINYNSQLHVLCSHITPKSYTRVVWRLSAICCDVTLMLHCVYGSAWSIIK